MKTMKFYFGTLLLIVSNTFIVAQSNLLAENDNKISYTNHSNVKTEKAVKSSEENVDEQTFEIRNDGKNKTLYSNGINYYLPKSGFVTIKINDREGNEVANLVNSNEEVGNHYANFSTFNLTSGIYQYEILINEKTYLSRMLIVN
ncbi:MAG: hypothetical protein H6610_04075 [Ignavibacteriales bacterium]|nr:hypothetical protein [Ignavibacteriales bacterium]MCB9218623.1 hypothetical protein [Ignavibacteriales bacterium]